MADAVTGTISHTHLFLNQDGTVGIAAMYSGNASAATDSEDINVRAVLTAPFITSVFANGRTIQLGDFVPSQDELLRADRPQLIGNRRVTTPTLTKWSFDPKTNKIWGLLHIPDGHAPEFVTLNHVSSVINPHMNCDVTGDLSFAANEQEAKRSITEARARELGIDSSALSLTPSASSPQVPEPAPAPTAESTDEATPSFAAEFDGAFLTVDEDGNARITGVDKKRRDTDGDTTTVHTPKIVAFTIDGTDYVLGRPFPSQKAAEEAGETGWLVNFPRPQIDGRVLVAWWPLPNGEIGGIGFDDNDTATKVFKSNHPVTDWMALDGRHYKLDGDLYFTDLTEVEAQPEETPPAKPQSGDASQYAFSACWLVELPSSQGATQQSRKYCLEGIVERHPLFGRGQRTMTSTIVSNAGDNTWFKTDSGVRYDVGKLYESEAAALAAGAVPGVAANSAQSASNTAPRAASNDNGTETEAPFTVHPAAASALDKQVAELAARVAKQVVGTEDVGITGTVRILLHRDGSETIQSEKFAIKAVGVTSLSDVIVQAALAYTKSENVFTPSNEPGYHILANIMKSKSFVDEASGVSLHLRGKAGPEIHLPDGSHVSFGKGCPTPMINRLFRECCAEFEKNPYVAATAEHGGHELVA